MPRLSRDVFLLVIVSGLVWTTQDQLQRIDSVTPVVALWMLAIVLICFACWAAWRARGSWRAAGLGAAALSVGMQVGRFVSDFLSGIDWSAPDHWRFWGSAWPVLLAINVLLVLIFLLPVRWVQGRWHNA